jgi:hypothetical protein
VSKKKDKKEKEKKKKKKKQTKKEIEMDLKKLYISDSKADLLTRKGMKDAGRSIAKYLEFFTDVLIIPEKFMGEKKELERNLDLAKKVIKKLDRGDISAFDIEEFEEEDFI